MASMSLSTVSQSLLFHLETCEDPKSVGLAGRASFVPSHIAFAKDRVSMLTATSTSFAQQLLRDVRCSTQTLLYDSPTSDVDPVELACRLTSMGYSLAVRSALGGGGSCFRNLRHEFLLVRGTGDEEGVDHVVDLRFREQFVVPQGSDNYRQLLEAVPVWFVGPLGKLLPLVQLVCGEMAESFRSQGLTLPPWRRTSSMLSKWMPTRVRDLNLTEPGGSPPAVTARPLATEVADPLLTASAFQRISADVYSSTARGASPPFGAKDADDAVRGGLGTMLRLERRPTVHVGFPLG